MKMTWYGATAAHCSTRGLNILALFLLSITKAYRPLKIVIEIGRTNFLPVQPGALLPFKNLLGSVGPE